jgi:hypothetical protein
METDLVSETESAAEPEAWHVLICGLELEGSPFNLGESLTLKRLDKPLTVFDLAGIGAVGFRQ